MKKATYLEPKPAAPIVQTVLATMDKFADVPGSFDYGIADFRSDFSRLWVAAKPLRNIATEVKNVILWKDHVKSSVILVVLVALVYLRLMSLILTLATLIAFTLQYLQQHTSSVLVREHLNRAEPNFATHAAATPDKPMLPQISADDLAWCHMIIRDAVSVLERLTNLVKWTNPTRTLCCLACIVAAGILTPFVSLDTVLPLAGYATIVYMFVLVPLQTHYPRYRRLFSPIEWLLYNIPEFAQDN